MQPAVMVVVGPGGTHRYPCRVDPETLEVKVAFDEWRLETMTITFELEDDAQKPHGRPPLDLTPAHARIAALICEGLTGPQIAQRLHLSPKTVRNCVYDALQRNDLRNRAHLAALYVRDHYQART